MYYTHEQNNYYWTNSHGNAEPVCVSRMPDLFSSEQAAKEIKFMVVSRQKKTLVIGNVEFSTCCFIAFSHCCDHTFRNNFGAKFLLPEPTSIYLTLCNKLDLNRLCHGCPKDPLSSYLLQALYLVLGEMPVVQCDFCSVPNAIWSCCAVCCLQCSSLGVTPICHLVARSSGCTALAAVHWAWLLNLLLTTN